MDQESIDQLKEALSFSPNNIPLRLHLADLLFKLKRFDESELEFQEVLSFQAENTKAKFGLATIYFEKGNWQLAIPDQEQTATSCKPLDNSANSTYRKAIIEIHSHHGMRAYFSDTDNRDETGFRIYGVMGEIFSNPQIRMRVGIYGHFYETTTTGILELPAQLTDCLVEDW